SMPGMTSMSAHGRRRCNAAKSARAAACPVRPRAAMAGAPAGSRNCSPMVDTLGERYRALISAGEIERDPGQESVIRRRAGLEARLAQVRLARKSSSLGWLFGRGAPERGPIKGVYIHGDVGRGKTMLMDLFFAAAAVERKRRVHFHEFMLDAHARIHAWRQQRKRGEVKGEDPIPPVAAALAAAPQLLCFDELNCTR